MNYKSCAVPQCTSTTIKTPEKLFVKVPDNLKMREKWLKIAKRDPKGLSNNTIIWFCEDHFNMESDMENYMQFKIMGSVKRMRMKVNCLPTKFLCQSNQSKKTSSVRSNVAEKQGLVLCKEVHSSTQIQETSICSIPQPEKLILMEYSETNIKKDDELDFKVEVEENIKIEVGSHEEMKEALQEQYVVSNQPEIGNNNTTISVPREYACISLEVKNEVGFKVKFEEVKIEMLSYQEDFEEVEQEYLEVEHDNYREELKKASQEQYAKLSENNIKNSNELAKRNKSVPMNNEWNVDDYIGESKEAPQKQIVEPDEGTYMVATDGIKTTKRKRNGTGTDQTQKKFKCEVCEYSTNQFYTLKVHRRIHEKIPMYFCSVCGKQNNQANNLKRHMMTHLKEAETIQEIEAVEINEKLDIKSKIKAIIKGKDYDLEVYKCGQCGYTTSHLSSLQYHIKGVHLNKKGFRCKFCSFSSERKDSVEIHVKRRHACFILRRLNMDTTVHNDQSGTPVITDRIT